MPDTRTRAAIPGNSAISTQPIMLRTLRVVDGCDADRSGDAAMFIAAGSLQGAFHHE